MIFLPNEIWIKIFNYCDYNSLKILKTIKNFLIFSNILEKNILKININYWNSIYRYNFYKNINYDLENNVILLKSKINFNFYQVKFLTHNILTNQILLYFLKRNANLDFIIKLFKQLKNEEINLYPKYIL
jgi:hypothetical protein